MFDRSYAFNLIDKKTNPDAGVLCRSLYNFVTPRRRYIALVENYRNNIYIIKYYADCHSKSKNKYSFVYNDEYAPAIIRTCVNIMLVCYGDNQMASFGFIGAHSIDKGGKKGSVESKINTQRFRIYQQVMFTFFGKKTFAHSRIKQYSAYLMINRKNGKIRPFKKSAEITFSKMYLGLTT